MTHDHAESSFERNVMSCSFALRPTMCRFHSAIFTACPKAKRIEDPCYIPSCHFLGSQDYRVPSPIFMKPACWSWTSEPGTCNARVAQKGAHTQSITSQTGIWPPLSGCARRAEARKASTSCWVSKEIGKREMTCTTHDINLASITSWIEPWRWVSLNSICLRSSHHADVKCTFGVKSCFSLAVAYRPTGPPGFPCLLQEARCLQLGKKTEPAAC